MADLRDLELMLESRYPIVIIETWEEPRALALLRRFGIKEAIPVFGWSVTQGLSRLEFDDGEPQRHAIEPEAALGQIKSTTTPGIYALCDFHPFLKDEPKNVRLIKEIAMQHDKVPHTLVLISHGVDIPAEFSRYCARLELRLPDDEQLRAIVESEARNWSRSKGQKVVANRSSLDKLVRNLRGCTYEDARKLVRGAIVEDGAIREDDLPEVNKAKFQLLDMDGVLSFEYDTQSFANVGGLENLKDWLHIRQDAFLEGAGQEAKSDAPKGMMLVGVQGGGKSLAAKAVAGLWHLPLLRLDMGAIFNKFFGESERNLREALKMAETMSPCVLWLDEIEKGMAMGENDGGTSRRVLGTFLTWMAENQSQVFLVATANDIERLPPELIRKGRLDEIFFVDLPNSSIREVIFSIHLNKRDQDPALFDLRKLSEWSEGFTGAEIEQAVVSAIYSARAAEEPLTTTHLIRELEHTVPLSVTMSEKIAALRQWCAGRAVPVDAPEGASKEALSSQQHESV